MTHTRAVDKPTQKLAFSEKLVGKGHTTDTLLKKLKSLHTQLADLDQDLVDVNSLSGVRKELIHTSILLHKDRGVKAYAACCLADILRLYAPDAPYTQTELRDIFQFFLKQLTIGLKGVDSSYYNEYFHLLESLSTVKSIVLVCDLDNAEELMTDIFRDFFGMVRRDLAKKIEIFMAEILVALIDECQVLPAEVLEILMAQFMDENAVNIRMFPVSRSPTHEFTSEWTNLHSVLPYKYATQLQISSNDTSASTSPISSYPTHKTKRWSRFGRPMILLNESIAHVQLSYTVLSRNLKKSSV